MLSRYTNQTPSIANPKIQQAGIQFHEHAEAAYGEHIKNTCALCNTSAAHTYGNVLAVIEQAILKRFPEGLFKHVTTSTTLAKRQIRHLPSQLVKLERPVMVLHPRMVFGQGEDRFLSHTIFNDRVTDTHSYWGYGSLIPMAKDIKDRIYVHGHYNRAVMFVDFILSFDTYTEQMNWMSFLYNMMPIGHNQFIQAPLELYIPSNFCQLIGKMKGMDVQEEDGSVTKFLQYMNQIWNYPITYKLKGSSNRNEFFLYYITDIDTVVQDVQAGEGVKMGQTWGMFDISFTIRCEFNTIGYFTLNAPKIQTPIHLGPTEDTAIATMFTDVIDLNDFELPLGWAILGWPIFKLAIGESSISLDPILNESLRAVIEYHLTQGIPMERFIRIQFRENGMILGSEGFYIDWHKRILYLMHPDYRRTYRLIVTIAPEYINNLIKDLYNLE